MSLPRHWRVAICLWAGVVLGLGIGVAHIANATSYLSDSPSACINCHVMTDAYASWQRGSHAHATVCIDCHVPHDNVVAKYAYKGYDGFRHSYVFTLHKEPQVLHLSHTAERVVQANCVHCHADQLQMIRLAETGERKCWDCHTNIHGTVHSLSSSPRPLRPKLPPAGIDLDKKGDKP